MTINPNDLNFGASPKSLPAFDDMPFEPGGDLPFYLPNQFPQTPSSLVPPTIPVLPPSLPPMSTPQGLDYDPIGDIKQGILSKATGTGSIPPMPSFAPRVGAPRFAGTTHGGSQPQSARPLGKTQGQTLAPMGMPPSPRSSGPTAAQGGLGRSIDKFVFGAEKFAVPGGRQQDPFGRAWLGAALIAQGLATAFGGVEIGKAVQKAGQSLGGPVHELPGIYGGPVFMLMDRFHAFAGLGHAVRAGGGMAFVGGFMIGAGINTLWPYLGRGGLGDLAHRLLHSSER